MARRGIDSFLLEISEDGQRCRIIGRGWTQGGNEVVLDVVAFNESEYTIVLKRPGHRYHGLMYTQYEPGAYEVWRLENDIHWAHKIMEFPLR